MLTGDTGVRYHVHMNTKTTLPISEARKNIFEIAERVQRSSTYYTLTERGRPKAVIMSAEEFESWQETLEVMRDFPDLEKDIKEARKDYKKGNYVTLEEILADEGFVAADTSKRRHAVSSRRTKKGPKRARKN